ncbi:FAD-binding oxidoreductase [Dethiobacter alkaliphilus]|uniref:FAD-binding oxidoreductase n=1 Tax=Dethiobacter alkaliphilus TaxID=427926 RepID=UPI0029620975|nr:FAD-linked oxidase C-terminal domain-containing protein [Dethiobacter alkaliphilus]
MYQPVTPAIAEKLAAIVGSKNLIYQDEEKLENYSRDEVAEKEYARMPEVVVKPNSAQEVSAVMKLANDANIPVTPRGAGTGLSGGAVAAHGGILLSVENMNRILEVDLDNLMVVVEPGVVTNEINETLKEHGLFFAGYPMSLQSCFVGGNVAENAGGGRAIKYGVTGRYILGLEVVLPDGEIVQFGGKRVKDVTGYNMVQLLVGSEGTLGIFTKIIIKLLPLPTTKIDLLALFPDVETAINVVPRIMTEGRLVPTGIEFMDRLSISTTHDYLGEKMPYPETNAALLIELDGSSAQQLRDDALAVSEILTENGAMEVYAAETPDTQEKIWKVRRNIAEAFKAISPVQSLEDIVVPIARIPDLMPVLAELQQKYDVLIPCYGHAGDGNLHATVVKKTETDINVWRETLPRLLEELYQKVFALGGTISGEHGIGYKRKSYLPLVLSEAEIALMKKIKLAFDPKNILNPGKIFDLT